MKKRTAELILKDPEKFAHHDRVFLNNPVVMQGMGLAPLVVVATTGQNGLMLAAAVTLLLSVAEMLVPQGSLREIASFTGGLILLAVLMQPLGKIDPAKIDLNISRYQEAVEQRQAELEASQKEELASLIESEMETYISDKAKSMGLTLRVRVTAEPDGSGVPVPVSVELTGPRSETLSQWLETELGLPAERQVWNEN